MQILDRMLGHFLGDDLTETAWWTDAVFRALEQDRLREQGVDTAVAPVTSRELEPE